MNRRDLIAGMAAAGIALAAGLYRFTDLFVKHYPPTPYDDLLGKLTDRAQAAKLGAKVAAFDVQSQVARLRASLQNRSLAAAADADIAAGRMAEVEGWVLPQTLVSLSALAAKA
ncbi:MAG TPA: twin-arginine translocation signal domain-containing protein [Rhizomicrobium sp.]|nr:twin-arginine translocation signal domain-containing protein [Rhizomicrobium sp.]